MNRRGGEATGPHTIAVCGLAALIGGWALAVTGARLPVFRQADGSCAPAISTNLSAWPVAACTAGPTGNGLAVPAACRR